MRATRKGAPPSTVINRPAHLDPPFQLREQQPAEVREADIAILGQRRAADLARGRETKSCVRRLSSEKKQPSLNQTTTRRNHPDQCDPTPRVRESRTPSAEGTNAIGVRTTRAQRPLPPPGPRAEPRAATEKRLYREDESATVGCRDPGESSSARTRASPARNRRPPAGTRSAIAGRSPARGATFCARCNSKLTPPAAADPRPFGRPDLTIPFGTGVVTAATFA
jgi:hypothetical protein